MSQHNRIRNISIEPTMNGYIVKIVCQSLSFESRTNLLSELGKYLDNPQQMEKEYVARYGNCFRDQLEDQAPMAENRVQMGRIDESPKPYPVPGLR